MLDGLSQLNGLVEPDAQPVQDDRASSRSSSASSESRKGEAPEVPTVKRQSQRTSSERLHRGSILATDDDDGDVLQEIRRLTLPHVPVSRPKKKCRPASPDKGKKLPVLPFTEKRQEDSPLLAALKQRRAAPKGQGSSQVPKKSTTVSSKEEPAAQKSLESKIPGSQTHQRRSFTSHQDLFNSVLPSESVKTHRRCSHDEMMINRLPDSARRGDLKFVTLKPINVVADSAVAALFESDEKKAALRPTRKDGSRFNTGTSSNGKDRSQFNTGAGLSDGGPPSVDSQEHRRLSRKGSKVVRTMRRMTSILEPVLPSQRLCLQRRYACEALRLFVFGAIGNESVVDQKEKNDTYYEGVGTKEQISELYQLWLRLDDDGSGTCDVAEFRNFCNRKGATKVQRQQGDKVLELLLGKGSSFEIQDMMRILWPSSSAEQLQHMLDIVEECRELEKVFVTEPAVLPDEDLDALVCTFRHLDPQHKGWISYTALFTAGLVDQDQSGRLEDEWDVSGLGQLPLNDFLLMMCPAGFRVYSDSRIGYDKQGNIIGLSPHGAWRPLDGVPKSWLEQPSLAHRSASKELLL